MQSAIIGISFTAFPRGIAFYFAFRAHMVASYNSFKLQAESTHNFRCPLTLRSIGIVPQSTYNPIPMSDTKCRDTLGFSW